MWSVICHSVPVKYTHTVPHTPCRVSIYIYLISAAYLSVLSVSFHYNNVNDISLDPANSSSTSAELGLCFVDLIWFSVLIVDAAIYACIYSSRWRSKNLVLPPPLTPISGFIRSATRVFLIHPLNHEGQSRANVCWKSREFFTYLHVYQAWQNKSF